ncbi:hypothetical protein PAPHI01_2683, partial [Pancytospora philotis]
PVGFVRNTSLVIEGVHIRTDFYVLDQEMPARVILGYKTLRFYSMLDWRKPDKQQGDTVLAENKPRGCLTGEVRGQRAPAHSTECVIRIKKGAKLPRCRPYSTNALKEEFIQAEIKSLLENGLIEPASGECCVPVAMPQKGDSFRLCGDYRKINEITVSESYPFPSIEQTIQQASGRGCFSTLDLKSGYWQVPIARESRKYTAFICSQGTFQWTRMPFGLKNASMVFQRMMDVLMRDLIGKCCYVYIDDIVVFSDSAEDHEQALEQVLARLDSAGLIVNREKCKFRCTSVEFLGHEISKDGVRPSSAKIETIMSVAQPKSKKDVMSLIGLFNYFRRFVPNFAKVMCPLYDLLKQEQRFSWKEEHQQTLDTVKQAIAKADWLVKPDFSRPLHIETDASIKAVGAVLYQEIEGERVAIECMSKKLKGYEMNYTVTELECLAVYRAMEAFDRYVSGRKIVVHSDHQALKWLFQNKQRSRRLERWVMALQEYDFTVEYVQGKDLLAADALSRLVPEQETPVVAVCSRPTELRPDIIAQGHKETAHGGELATYKWCKESDEGAGVTVAMVRRAIKECSLCQQFNEGREKTRSYTIAAREPFETVGIDVVGPLPETKRGNRYVLVAVDYLTHWCEAEAVPEKTGEAIQRFIQERLCTKWATPKRLLSDNGREFIGDKLKQFLTKNDVAHVFSSPYYPQGNGLVEKTNHSLMRKVWKLAASNKAAWDWHLPAALRGYNISFQRRMGWSPVQILCGKNARDIDSTAKQDIASVDALVRQKERAEDLAIAHQACNTANEEGNFRDFSVGDTVYRKTTSNERIAGGKGTRRFCGPYKVTARNAYDQYEIQAK